MRFCTLCFASGRVQADCAKVYFTYPETRGIRLEEMDAIFGDATTALMTPATGAERASLVGRVLSPAPSLDIRRGGPTASMAAFPGLDVDPPFVHVENGKPQLSRKPSGEGVGGWISRMVARGKGDGNGKGNGDGGEGGDYRRLDQADDEE